MGNPLQDERWVLDLGNEIHEYVAKDAYDREQAAEERHKELVQVIETTGKATVKAIEVGFRLLADALRSR
jgi:hypothetical protein